MRTRTGEPTGLDREIAGGEPSAEQASDTLHADAIAAEETLKAELDNLPQQDQSDEGTAAYEIRNARARLYQLRLDLTELAAGNKAVYGGPDANEGDLRSELMQLIEKVESGELVREAHESAE